MMRTPHDPIIPRDEVAEPFSIPTRAALDEAERGTDPDA